MNLHDGIVALGLDLPVGSEERMMAFLALMAKWNRAYNLTSVTREAEMVTHHLLDSLSLLPHLGGARTLADIGSGAGLPGLVLALVRPDLALTSVETVGKKVAFQQQAKIEFRLGNVTVHGGRVEEFHPAAGFDAVVSRAFASLADFVALAGHLVAPGGRLLAMKGVLPADEIAALPAAWRVVDTPRLTVPGLDAQRHLIILERV
jgi:16S rRNA (guanine527-N7)-methyltransferase